MSSFIFGLLVGLVVGVIATTLVFRKNKSVQDKANEIVEKAKDRIDS